MTLNVKKGMAIGGRSLRAKSVNPTFFESGLIDAVTLPSSGIEIALS